MWGHIPRNSHKFLYIRAVSDIADDDIPSDSVCFPVSAIKGFAFQSATLAIVRFESPFQYVLDDNGNADGCLFQITSNSHKTFMENLAKEIAFGEDNFIVLGDNVTGEYLSGVTSVSGINADIGAD